MSLDAPLKGLYLRGDSSALAKRTSCGSGEPMPLGTRLRAG